MLENGLVVSSAKRITAVCYCMCHKDSIGPLWKGSKIFRIDKSPGKRVRMLIRKIIVLIKEIPPIQPKFIEPIK